MKENELADMSMEFAVEIITLVKVLKEQRETVISNQIGRSGTSIGANIREANYAQGKRDFISKLEIALKESSETDYWLELLYKAGYVDQAYHKKLNDLCTSIRVMLIASCRTAKDTLDNKRIDQCSYQMISLSETSLRRRRPTGTSPLWTIFVLDQHTS